MTPTDWLLLMIAVMLFVVFFERVMFVLAVSLVLFVTALSWLFAGVLGPRH